MGPPIHTLPLIGTMQTKLSEFGWLGVDLFFVLSAFLVTYLLRQEQLIHGRISLPKFYARRILRIWPLYFCVLAIAGVLWPLLAHTGSLQMYGRFVRKILLPLMFFTGNTALPWNFNVIREFAASAGLDFMVLATVLTPFWSLCVEEQFYLAWGLLFSLVKDARKLLALFFAIAAGGLTMPFILLHVLRPQSVGSTCYYMSTGWHVTPIIFGAIAAIIVHERPRWFDSLKSSVASVPLLIASVATFAMVLLNSPDIHSWKLQLGYVMAIVSAVFTAWLLLALYWTPCSKILSFRPMTSIGKITFGMYVFHYFVIARVKPWLRIEQVDTLSWLAVASVCFSATALAAALSWFVLEGPANRLRHRLSQIEIASPIEVPVSNSRLIEMDTKELLAVVQSASTNEDAVEC